MASLKATSKTKFKHSGKNSPHTKEIFKARSKKEVKVRKWAGKANSECSFSPLAKNAIVSVCDAILSKAGNTWYYIKYKGHYGFVYSGHFQSVSNNAIRFVDILNTYHKYIKEHGSKFKYKFESSLDSFLKAVARVEAGEKAGMTCLVPMGWALQEMGIRRSDAKVWVSGDSGSFKSHYTGGVKNKFDRITSGSMIGLTVKESVDLNLLKIGDMIAFKDKTHTVAYTGKDYLMFDGGHNSMKNDIYTGIIADYKNYKHEISEILRWKE